MREIIVKSNKIKAARVEKGLTQNDMRKLLGMTIANYNLKENGKREFTLTEAKKLSNILEKSIDYFF